MVKGLQYLCVLSFSYICLLFDTVVCASLLKSCTLLGVLYIVLLGFFMCKRSLLETCHWGLVFYILYVHGLFTVSGTKRNTAK